MHTPYTPRLRRPLLAWLTGCMLLALPWSPSTATAADIYKWKDADGKVHMSDRPPDEGDAERLNIRSYSGPAEVSTVGDSSSKSVVMLSASWCGVCKQARAWMLANSVPFTEHDVETSQTGKTEFRRLDGKAVPIILVGDRRMNGFSADRLKAMLKN